MKQNKKTRRANTLFTLAALLVVLMSQTAIAQLIGEGDTLWYKDLYPNTITQVQFSPDGTKLGVVSYDNNYVGKFVMFDAMNGNELWSFQKATHYFKQFSYSFDGNHIYLIPPTNKQINVLDINSGFILDTLPINKELNLDMDYDQVFQTKNPDVLLLGNSSGDFALYSKNARKLITEKTINSISKINTNQFSDNFIIAYQYEFENKWKTIIYLYNINTLEFVSKLGEEDGLVETSGDIKISYNGKYAATNFGGRALQIWDIENKKLFKEYTPTIPTDSTDGRGGQFSLAFAHTNDLLINCGGQMLFDPFSYTTTITNFINDKRALISIKDAYRRIDISKNDTFFAGSLGSNFLVFKLHKNLVPVEEITGNTIPLLYPNPTTGDISIDLIGNQFVESVRINDLQSNEVTKISKNDIIQSNSKVSINLPKLNNGIYLLNVITNNGIISYKLIMEN